jgi:DAK2 domain fusion protein YloV
MRGVFWALTDENRKRTTAQPVTGAQCDGQSLKLALFAARQWLEKHAAAVNALNVFPVPDGDTGTNMLLTMNAALAEIGRSSDENSVSVIAHAVAHGALMGARGNSGVILSQIFRGFARALDDKATFSAREFADAAQEACDTAYQGVVKPVEGTILTVTREAARAAREAAGRQTGDIVEALAQVVEAARVTNALTPELLPVLKEAGVVDAGGQGLVYILEGALRYLQGESLDIDIEIDAVVDLKSMLGAGEEGYGYDVQFLISGESLDVDQIRITIDAMGECALVVGDASLVKVHVHVHDPGVPISYGVSQGVIGDVVVENMEGQYQGFVSARARAVDTEEITNIATICVAPGEGLKRVFESLGVSAIVHGGQTMNPSTQEILGAIQSVSTEEVLVLPNNSNVILAARQASELSSKNVIVVPTKTVPQGISALLAFNYQADIETNAERMTLAASEIETIEVTRAVRSTQINGIDVSEGDIIGLLNDRLVAAGGDYTAVILDVLIQASADDYEVATIYYGGDATLAEANELAEQIVARYPGLEIEVHEGGQAHYRHILSLE